MAQFQLPRLSPNLRAYFSHFGRSIILAVGISVVVVLAAATYFYGQRKHDEVAPKPDSTPSTSEQAPVQNPSDTSSSAPSPSPVQDTSPAPSTIINTGSEDWALPAIMAICVLATLYRRSRQQLSTALQAV